MYRMDLSFTRPTYTLSKADPQKQEQFKQNFELLKNLLDGNIDLILFEDESMIRDYQAIQKTWFHNGQQWIIPTYGKNEGVKLLGVLNYETGHIYCEENEKYHAEVFKSFLQNIIKLYPTGKIVMILDNSRIHHAKLLEPFLLEHEDSLQFVFLPPYSPKLNLIEGLWGWLKLEIINNLFYSSVKEIHKAVSGFIDSLLRYLKW